MVRTDVLGTHDEISVLDSERSDRMFTLISVFDGLSDRYLRTFYPLG